MADEAIKRLIELGINATPAVEELKKLREETKKQTEGITQLQDQLASFGKGVTIAGTLTLAWQAANAVIDAVRGVINEMDELGKRAQGLGVGVEALQELEYAADLSGVKTEQLDKALVSLSDKLATVESGTDRAAQTLRAFGVTGQDDAYTALLKIADGFSQASDGVDKTAAAVDLFGQKLGAKMIPLLNSGADGLREAGDEARRFGQVLDQETIKAAEEFNDNLTRIDRNVKALGMALVKDLLPWLRDLTDQLVNNIKQFGLLDGAMQTLMERMFGTTKGNMTKELDDAYASIDRIQKKMNETIAKQGEAGMQSIGYVALTKELEKQNAVIVKARENLKAYNDILEPTVKAAAPVGDGKMPAIVDDKKGGGVAKRMKEARVEIEKVKEEISDVDKILQDILKKTTEFETLPHTIAELERRLQLMKEAGLENSTVFANLTKRIRELKSTTDPIEKARLEVEALAKAQEDLTKTQEAWFALLLRGEVTQEAYEKKMAEIGKAVATTGTAMEEQVTSLSESVAKMSAVFVTDFIDEIIDGMGEAEQSFTDMVETFLKQLAKLMVSSAMQDFLKVMESAGSGGGILDTIIGAITGKRSVQAATVVVPTGVMTSPSFRTSSGGTSATGMSPPGSGDSISIGASPVEVNIYNNAGAEVKQETRDNADGSRQIDIYIERKVKELIGSGAMDRTMRSAYGVSRQPSIG